MKMYETVEVYLHALLALALGGGEWSASCPWKQLLTRDTMISEPLWAQWKREKSLPHQESNPDSSAVQTVY
jgi:hypothetical protein